MQLFIVFAAALGVASASHLKFPLTYAAHAQHLPVIGANGVPVDTPEVQHARAAHLAHKVEAHARNGDVAVVASTPPVISTYAAAAAPIVTPVVAHHTYAAATPVVAHHAYAAAAPVVAATYAAVPAAYPTTLGVPAVTANGIPLETPEVVAAKSNHFAAHAEALARNSPIYAEAGPVIGYNAFSAYAAAPVTAYAAAPVHAYAAAPVTNYAAPAVIAKAVPAVYATTIGLPAVTANGIPLETPEVVAAKANHFAAHAEAAARSAW